jgi:hypothetical protein
MPYCSGCGSRYQEGDRVCKSCGFELSADAQLPNVAKGARPGKKNPKARRQKRLAAPSQSKIATPQQSTEPTVKIGQEEREAIVEPMKISGTRQLQSEALNLLSGSGEIHLGKGIIKPKVIERDVDGYHFKYEEQPQPPKKGETFFIEQGAELHAINPEFVGELPSEATPHNDAVSNEIRSHSETLEVTGNAYLFKNGAKPTRLVTGPASQPKTTPNSAATASRDLVFEEDLDVRVIDSLKTELREMEMEMETAMAEVRQAEDDLIGEMETAEKVLGTVAAEIEATEAVEAFPGAEADFSDIDASLTKTVEMDEIQAEVTTVPAPESVFGNPFGDEIKATVQTKNQVCQTEVGLDQPAGELETILEGQQSWYGIPLPYYYRLSERFLVCTDTNGHSIEYDLTMIKKVTVKQSWLGKFLNIGDVVLDFTNQVPSRYILAGVVNPTGLRTRFEELVRNMV